MFLQLIINVHELIRIIRGLNRRKIVASSRLEIIMEIRTIPTYHVIIYSKNSLNDIIL